MIPALPGHIPAQPAHQGAAMSGTMRGYRRKYTWNGVTQYIRTCRMAGMTPLINRKSPDPEEPCSPSSNHAPTWVTYLHCIIRGEPASTSDFIGLDGEQSEVVWSSPVCGPQVACRKRHHQDNLQWTGASETSNSAWVATICTSRARPLMHKQP